MESVIVAGIAEPVESFDVRENVDKFVTAVAAVTLIFRELSGLRGAERVELRTLGDIATRNMRTYRHFIENTLSVEMQHGLFAAADIVAMRVTHYCLADQAVSSFKEEHPGTLSGQQINTLVDLTEKSQRAQNSVELAQDHLGALIS